MSKHTPGPWFATNAQYPDDHRTMQGTETGQWTVSTDPDAAGWTNDGGYPGYGVSKANAVLMAAAPELLVHVQAQHNIIDTLLAMLIERDHTFRPTHQPFWPTIAKTVELIERSTKGD